jgi:murein DD-endopeptidase MepM/ murein hydrolase activator NlpD
MTSYIQRHGDQMVVVLVGEKYMGVPTGGDIWLLSGAEAGPGPGTPPSTGDQTFDWPFDPNTTVTSEYGPRDGRVHQGIDFGKGGVTTGVDIHAAAQGVVTRADRNHTHQDGSGFGNCVIINHGNIGGRQIYTVYGHMLYPGPFVNVGDSVEKWDVIGQVNDTGNSYGSHLHWETHLCNPGGSPSWSNPGTHVNPRTFMATYQDVPVPEVNMEGY